mmetsp:Transcript_92548/g.193489  ORF Transcript_92548/g.193489 Transcript_92548/m.193489 type:complete len:510 (-) Transcript_92548:297-1826(-)
MASTPSSAAIANTQAKASAVEPCTLGCYEDLIDIGLLTAVFCIGWLLMSLFTRKMGRRVQPTPSKEVGLWSGPSDNARSCSAYCASSLETSPVHISTEKTLSAGATDAFDQLFSIVKEETSSFKDEVNHSTAPACPEGEKELSIEGVQESGPRWDSLSTLQTSSSSSAHKRLSNVRWLCRHRGITPACQALKGLRQAGVAVDLATLRVLLSASCKHGDLSQAIEFYEEIEQLNHGPDAVSASALVRGYCAAGDLDQALQLFRTLRFADVVCDCKVFDALLDLCAARNMMSLADEVLSEMSMAGVRPTNSTLAALLKLHGNRGQLSEALELFEEMPRLHEGFQADGRSYHALIQICLRLGQLDKASEVFATMLNSGVAPLAKTYESLIASALSRGNLEVAVALVRDAGSLPHGPRINEFAAGGFTRQARAVLERTVVESVLKLCCRRGFAASLALPLIDDLAEAGFETTESLREATRAAAARKSEGRPSKVPEANREAQWQSWRNTFGTC